MGFSRTWLEGQRLGGQSRANAVGVGRVRPQRLQSVTPPVGGIPVCRSTSSPRKRFARRAHGHSRCWVSTPIARRLLMICAPGKSGRVLADRLMTILASVETPDWVWFEEGLAYDNARLPQALIVTGMATQTPRLRRCRVEILALADDRSKRRRRVISARSARPVSASGGNRPRAFDQQPVEATATIAACLAAWRADGDCRVESRGSKRLSHGSSAAMICPCRWSICRPAAAATDCIPTVPTKIAGASRSLCYLLGLAEIRQLGARQRRPDETCRTSRRRRLNPNFIFQRAEGTVSQATFLNRQALYLRPDPARVIVRPFKPATEPRDLNPTDKTRANHIVERVLALDSEAARQPTRRRAGEFPGPAPQPAGDVRSPRRRNGRGLGGARQLFPKSSVS